MSQIFELFVEDDRYNVPTLSFVLASDAGHAVVIAEKLLAESPHHHGVEARRNGRRLFGLGSCAARAEGATARPQSQVNGAGPPPV